MMEKYVAEHGAKAVLRKNTSPVYKPADTAEIKTLLAAHDYVTGEKGVPYTIGGGTYAKHFEMQLPSVPASTAHQTHVQKARARSICRMSATTSSVCLKH